MFESFSNDSAADTELRRQWLIQHATLGLRQASRCDNLPLLRLSLKLQAFSNAYRAQRTWIFTGLGVCLGLLILAVAVPADLEIRAKGTLQPRALRHLYAPANGEIVAIRAEHQDAVRSGDDLLIIRSREHELKKEELLTQRRVTQEKLRSIEAARLGDRRTASAQTESAVDLSSSERELTEVLVSQNQQLAIIDELLASLTLTSPIDGCVVSWDPSENLEGRPVQQGQKLMSIAQPSGEGLLELHVFDEDLRHVQQAQAQSASPILVTFVIASDPGHQHTGRIHRIGTLAETLFGERASVRVEVVVDASEMVRATPGATVNAKIHCGRAKRGYVWTRRLWDYLRMQLI